MTAIRDELPIYRALARIVGDIPMMESRTQGRAVCEYLGIDPDLPAEWGTVDRCLAWLRERKQAPLHINVPPDGASTVWLGRTSDGRLPHYGRTAHAALVAACKAVQESAP